MNTGQRLNAGGFNRELLDHVGSEQIQLDLGHTLPRALSLAHAKGHHGWVGHKLPLGIDETLRTELFRLIKVSWVVHNLPEVCDEHRVLGKLVIPSEEEIPIIFSSLKSKNAFSTLTCT